MMSRRATARQLDQISDGLDGSDTGSAPGSLDPLSVRRFKSHDSMDAPSSDVTQRDIPASRSAYSVNALYLWACSHQRISCEGIPPFTWLYLYHGCLLRCLDIARGCTVALMLFVNHVGKEPEWIAHAPWNGLHLADLVMPCFLLIVGMSAALSLTAGRKRGAATSDLLQRVLSRAGKLFALGVLIQGGVASEGHFPVWDLARLRVFGVLQRIAVCSLFASLLVLYVPECQLPKLETQWERLIAKTEGAHTIAEHEESLSSYWLLVPFKMYAYWWSFALAYFSGFLVFSLLIQPRGCDKWPALAPDCNMAASADAWLLGPQHLYPYSSCRRMDPPCEHFDPEGLFTTMSGAVVSTFIGLWFGCVTLALTSHRARLKAWACASILLFELGVALHVSDTIPLNKNLYSASYIMVTAGTSGAFLATVYLLTDVLQHRIFLKIARPFVWLGLNSMTVYVGDEILERALPLVYWGRRGNDLLGLIRWMFHAILGDGWFCSLAMALADVAFWIAVAGLLHRRRWCLKV